MYRLTILAVGVILSICPLVAQTEPVLPDSYKDQALRKGPVLELSMRDAVRLALTNNLEIVIENFNEEINRERLVGVRGFYDPVLDFRIGWNSSETPTSSILQAGQGIRTNTMDLLTLNTTLRQNVPGGGALVLALENNRNATNSVFRFINPEFGSNLRFQFTQPLWRGFQRTATRRQLRLYSLDREIGDRQFERKVSDIVHRVQAQYWELVYAVENHETRRKSLDLALIQHRNNQERVDIGVLAPIELTASRAEIASREQEMLQNEILIIRAQNALKRLLAPDSRHQLWNLTLLPTETPALAESQVTLEQAISNAFARRPELTRNDLEVQKNEVNREFFEKQGKPAFNLVTELGSVGRAGQVFRNVMIDTNGDGIPDTSAGMAPDPDHPSYGSFLNSWGQVAGFDYRNYGVYLDVQIPLRNRSNEAQLAETSIVNRQLTSSRRNVEQMVVAEVRDAYESIETHQRRLAAARQATELSREQLAGETQRFEEGLSTNFEVLRYQRDLAEAEVRELRALVDAQQAILDLQNAMYTLVEANDIVVARDVNGR
jgi:outer membrane protein TolC